MAYDALKKQMVFYQHTLSAAGLKRDGFKDPLPSFRERDRPELAGGYCCVCSGWRKGIICLFAYPQATACSGGLGCSRPLS